MRKFAAPLLRHKLGAPGRVLKPAACATSFRPMARPGCFLFSRSFSEESAPPKFGDEWETAFAKCQPYLHPPEYFNERSFRLAYQFPLKDSDVILATHQKSGTTWLQNIVYQLLTNGDESFGNISENIPFLENAHFWQDDDSFIPWPESKLDRRVIKTHFNWDMTPKHPKAKYICCARRGQDVVVSWLHHNLGYRPEFRDPNLSWEYSFDKFIEGKEVWGSWFEHVKGWHDEAKQNPNVLFITFQGAKKDPKGTLTRINDFIGSGRSPEEIEEILPKVSFDHMKANKRKFDHHYLGLFETEYQFFRKGAVKSEGEFFRPQDHKKFDEVFKKHFGDENPFAED